MRKGTAASWRMDGTGPDQTTSTPSRLVATPSSAAQLHPPQPTPSTPAQAPPISSPGSTPPPALTGLLPAWQLAHHSFTHRLPAVYSFIHTLIISDTHSHIC